MAKKQPQDPLSRVLKGAWREDVEKEPFKNVTVEDGQKAIEKGKQEREKP